MSSADSNPGRERRNRGGIIALAVVTFILFTIIFSEQAFNLAFLRPSGNEQTLIFAALSALIFLLLVALTFVLLRILLKLYAERRGGMLGSRFRTRMVLGALALSLTPVIFLFLFAYGLLNHSIDKWFSRPLQDVHADMRAAADLLLTYATNDARAEARAVAGSPETQQAFLTRDDAGLAAALARREPTLMGGFAVAISGDQAEAAYKTPAAWEAIRARLPAEPAIQSPHPPLLEYGGRQYMLAESPVMAAGAERGRILVALPLPSSFASTMSLVEESERRYVQLSRQRKLLRETYMGVLLLLTILVLFLSTWFALFLSKFVTRPVAALAAATEAISRGHLDYRIDLRAGDELGRLVHSFNRMAEELESNRRQLESSSRSIADANTALEQRRRQMETILESIPTGVLSLDAQRRVLRTNPALERIFRASGGIPPFSPGDLLEECLPAATVEDLKPMLRKADRMGSVTSQVEIEWKGEPLDLAVTVSSLQGDRQRLGYVLVFEDLSDLIRAQKQAAWREVARRVAHEIKNPLTPIALSAERIRRHLERGHSPDAYSLGVIRKCAATIAGAVETVHTLVNEFSTLARFPSCQPQPADLNLIVGETLALFEGRLDGIQLRTELAADLPLVMADAGAMKRALANLVDNAAEALQNSLLKEIHISSAMAEDKDAVEIVVADTGCGVSQELKEKLFLPYFSTKKRGTGLGLAIVSRIVEEHHGSIRVEENSPLGARFVVELPLAGNGTASAAPRDEAERRQEVTLTLT